MKHARLKRFLSLFLALIMVMGIIPANMIHAHETVAEDPAVVVEDGGNIVINDSSNVVVNAPTKGVTNENTRVEIDYNYQQYQTDKDGNLIYDENGKPIPVTALNALSFESEKNRELTYTYPNSTKPLDFDYYWSSSNKTKWNQVFKGDYTRDGGKLRELLESTDPDHKYIVLMEDIKCTVDYGKDYDPIIITGEKVLDLNGHTLELYDKRNGTKDQSSDVDDHVSYMFEIKGTGETQGNQGRLGGALLTVLDSAGSNIIYTDPKGETGPYYSDRVGKVYANAYMINHQKWDFWNYTHRDIFLVTGGDLVIYGGEFQAGRQQDQFKTGFSWSALKEVIGQTVALGSSVFEYASGISAATAAKEDKMEEIYPQGQKETGDSDNGQAKDKGTTGKKTGDGGTEEKKTETPATAGTAANPEAKKDQTVAQKQNDQNKKEDENKKGDKGTENKKDDKKAAKNDKNTQLDTLNKNIAKAALDKDKIMDMVDSALELGEGIYELFAKDNNTRCTACIQGTVARIGNECTMVIYGGTFIGHGSTPNVRNAVIETAYNSSLVTNVDTDPRYGKTKGGWVYVYDGIFEAYTGANVFNMYENAYNQKMDMYDVNPDGSVTLRENVPLLDCETYGIKEVRYKNYDAWKKAYNAMSDAQKEKADGPELVNTANISVRGGTFRCYYEYSNMAVLENGRGTDTSDGKYCTAHKEYHGSNGGECDDDDYRKFSGTPGYVNLGIESYDEDLIKDGRIQLVDVYGQGKLVLLDGGDPIEAEPDPDAINPATGLPYTDSELRDLDPDTGVAVEAPKTNYQTEGNFRHYRLYIGDQQLRSLAYLTVYPNTSITNSTFSFALETYWGTGTKTDLEWKSDDENIRAPYSSNEKFFDFEFDDTDTSSQNSGGAAGVYIIPQLNIPNALTAGEELHTSDVWYYNVPVNRYGETLGNVEVSDTYLETDSSVNGEKFVASFNKTKKSGEVYTEKFAWSLNDFKSWGGTYYNQTDANYKTNIKFFTYQIYRVDPLSRENINESDNWSDNEPLLEVRYGTGTDSLRCKLTLVKLEEQIRKAMREKHPEENWTGFSSGELYRVVFTVEEQVGFGYMGTQYDGEVKYLDTLNTARAQSSILFRCVSVNEYKEGTHENATTGTTAIGRVPDWTPLQFRGDVKAGDYANVELVNGQTALVDWQGVRVFDIYYQWYLLDSPDDETPTLIGGTDNVWVAQNSAGGKKNHKPRNFILKNDGSGVGINGELYANTVDPNSPEASMYEYGPNGLPTNSRLWNGEMLHMYTYETCPDDPGMRKDPNDDLYMANNYTFWGNTDSLYIPAKYAGKYLQCKIVAVNVRYPHLYDNLQTIGSHIVPISGIPHPGFASVSPTPNFDYKMGGSHNLGKFYRDEVPSFAFTANELSQEYIKQGYYLKLTTEDYVEGKLVYSAINGDTYKPTEYGEHDLVQTITIYDIDNQQMNSISVHHYFTIRYRPTIKTLSHPATAEELAAGKKDLGVLNGSIVKMVVHELPQSMKDQGYTLVSNAYAYMDGKLIETVTSDPETPHEIRYSPSTMGDYKVELVSSLIRPSGTVEASVSFTYIFNASFELTFEVVDPVIPESEMTAGFTDLGTIPLRTFHFGCILPAWVLDSYTVTPYVNDYVNGVKDTDIGYYENILYNNQVNKDLAFYYVYYTPAKAGNHEVEFGYTIKEDGRTIRELEHTLKFTINETPATGITIQGESYRYLSKRQSLTLSATVTPSNANQTVTWTSENPNIATVSSKGVVTAGSLVGTTMITATTTSGRKAVVYVTVTDTSDKVVVAGIALQPGQYLEQDGLKPVTTKPADNYAYLANVNNVLTLTLHNFNYEGMGYYSSESSEWYSIYADSVIKIVADGENNLRNRIWMGNGGTITCSNYKDKLTLSNGGIIVADGNLIIDDDVILDITVTAREDAIFMDYANDGDESILTFSNGATVNLTSADQCIFAGYVGDVVISNAYITCNTKATHNAAALEIRNGNFTMKSGRASFRSVGGNGITVTKGTFTQNGGTLTAEGGDYGVYVVSTTAPVTFKGNALLRSTAEPGSSNDSSYRALRIPSGATLTVPTSPTIRVSTEASGAGQAIVDETTLKANLATYDFVVFGSNVSILGLYIGGDYNRGIGRVVLLDGTMIYEGESTTVEGTEALNGSAYFEDGVLYLNDFDGELYDHSLQWNKAEPLEIHLTGENSLHSITTSNTVTFTGDGNLTIYNAGWTPVDSDDLVFSGTGTILITGGYDYSGAMFEPDSITVNSGNVIVRCEEGPAIVSAGTFLTFNGGTLLLEGIDVGYADGACWTSTWTVAAGTKIYAKNDSGDFTEADVWLQPSAESTSGDGKIMFADKAQRAYLIHTHVMSYVEAVANSCVTDGMEAYYTCNGCNAMFRDANGSRPIADQSQIIIPASGHSWMAATCENPKTCRTCGYTEGDALGHNWTAANCFDPKTCSVCKATEGEALGHTLEQGEVVQKPTCCTEGSLKSWCPVCRYYIYQPIPVDPEAHTITEGATCETAKECGECGMTFGTELGHRWKEATCDTPKTCETCGETEGSALGHEWVDASCTDPKHCMNCTATEGTALPHTWIDATCTTPKVCTSCGLKDGKSLGHSIASYIHTADNHIGTCSTCGETIMEAHVFEDGVCIICGRAEQAAPVLDANIKMNHTLNLASDISANFAIAKSLLTGYDMTTAYVEFEIDTYSGNEKTGTKTTKVAGVLNGNYYYFTFNGLNATMMNDDIRATFYGSKDGAMYKSNVDTYSVATYAYSSLDNPGRPESLKVLCANLLRYGANAQSYKSYRTNALADSKMTDAHKAYLTALDSVVFDTINKANEDMTDPSVSIIGKSLNLDSKVTLKFIVELKTYTGDVNDLTVVVNYTDINGVAKSATLTDPQAYDPAKNRYSFEFDGLLAAELRQPLTVAVYSGSTRLSGTIEYSASTYGTGKQGALKTLCQALMAYSDAAKAYFAG